MEPFFLVKENADMLEKAAKAWIGVKYHHMGTTKGGVDCTKLLAIIFEDIELLSQIEDCYYPRDWVWHRKQQVLRDSFEYHLQAYLRRDLTYLLLDYRENEILHGDILLMSPAISGIYSHSALFLSGNKIIQALERKGVFITDFGPYWQEMTGQIIRIFYKE